MKQFKWLSLFLSLLMLFSLVLPASASGTDTCSHVWFIYDREALGFHRISSSQCGERYRLYKECVVEGCNATTTSVEVDEDTIRDHDGDLTGASCNGTVQTWSFVCDYCDSSYTEKFRCPNAGHNGICGALPLGWHRPIDLLM